MPPLSDCRHDTRLTPHCNRQLEGRLALDAYHPFYHFQASAEYHWRAEALAALGRLEEAGTAFGRAVFQDHGNKEAAARSRLLGAEGWRVMTPGYAAYPLSEVAFRKSIGDERHGWAEAHDRAWTVGDPALLEALVAQAPDYDAAWFARGRVAFRQGDYGAAERDLAEAIRLSHLAHDAYHARASDAHLARGRAFFASGEWDLAVNEFTKALDLNGRNKPALAARAEAYRAKGSVRLAERDAEGRDD